MGDNQRSQFGRPQGKGHVGAEESRTCAFHSGWINIGKETKGLRSAQFHLIVKGELDPRFALQFDGEPKCNPQAFQIPGFYGRVQVFTGLDCALIEMTICNYKSLNLMD
ncbi:hypothetical protein NL676_034960 [Syzygium grande]|nr:hypothetical protein NL676_034960 [Syzygium grande]